MHADHEVFLRALADQKRVELRFISKEDQGQLSRECAPMDFGPSRRAKDGADRYHFWDFDSDTKSHVLSLLPDQIVSILALEQIFDPAEFVTWDVISSPWFVPRNWGRYS